MSTSLLAFSSEELNEANGASLATSQAGSVLLLPALRGCQGPVLVKRLRATPSSRLAVEAELTVASRCVCDTLLPVLGSVRTRSIRCLTHCSPPCGWQSTESSDFVCCVYPSPPPASSTLDEALSRPWLSARLRVQAAARVARGLVALHAAGFVHCDVRSASVVVSPAGDTFLCCCGLASGSPGVVRAAVAGARGCVDPAFKASLQHAPSVDVFGLGVLLVELLCGREAVATLEEEATQARRRSRLPFFVLTRASDPAPYRIRRRCVL